MKTAMARSLLVAMYGSRRTAVRKATLKIAQKLEGGPLYSLTLRAIFAEYHNVCVGMYSHGGCFVPGAFDPYTTIDRYCSIATTARGFNRNHPLEYRSTHALFFNPVLGVVDQGTVEYVPLHIGSDVWIGHNAIIMPIVENIGHGAVLAAGAVVNKDVPPYAVVVGNPARVVRYRFTEDIIAELLQSRWWENDLEQLDPQEMGRASIRRPV